MVISPERTKKFLTHSTSLPLITVSQGNGSSLIDRDVIGKFGIYEFLLLLLTQCGYLPVAAGLLSTAFFEPSKDFCTQFNTSTRNHILSETNEFYSLLFEWQEACIHSVWIVRMTTAVMLGAIVGSFLAGYLADRHGRKPVVVGTLLALAASNLLLLFFAAYTPYLALAIFFIAGCACGGYMVTNVVFILEAVRAERTRLLVASLNGWPIGMVFTGLIAYLCREWRWYCGTVAGVSACLAGLLYSRSFESVGWLDTRNKIAKAIRIRQQIVQQNQLCMRKSLSLRCMLDQKKEPEKLVEETKLEEQTEALITEKKTQTYLDLFRHKEIRMPLCALLYCFATSSIVSFGFYFTTEVMPGSRYANLALMGALKFTLGLIPYAISFAVTKKHIILGSVGSACLACWILALACTWNNQMLDSIVITVLGVAITASMDPTWKVSHLYSVELFPIAVRNMARGACNVTARLGSMAGPLIILLRSFNPLFPYWLFAILLTAQWVVLAVYMPAANPGELSKANQEESQA